MRKVQGGLHCQLVASFARLNIADHLQEPSEVGILAERLGLQEPLLERFLQAVRVLNLVELDEEGRYYLTEEGSYLGASHPDSLRPIALFRASPLLWRSFEKIEEGLRTGQSPFFLAHGCDQFTYFDEHPEAATLFHNAMDRYLEQSSRALLDHLQLDEAKSLTDIGGGSGLFLQQVKERYPHLQARLFDLPPIIAQAQTQHPGLECVAGDFFNEVPSGSDAYLLRNVLHDWDDERYTKIVASIARGAETGSRLILLETLQPDSAQSPLGRLADFNLFLTTEGGKVRSAEQHIALAEPHGFSHERTTQTTGSKGLLHFRKR